MSERENLFRPVHKGIRAMIYDLGRRVGTTDFRNATEAQRIADELRRDLSGSVSNCILCLLRAHSGHEERDFFSAVRPFDADAVELMVAEHRAIARRILDVSKTCGELERASSEPRRVELGDRLEAEANDIFASYLDHLNNEEATLVPLMWERFSDVELRALRARFYNVLPLPRFEEWMRWTLPALNPHELLVFFRGLKSDPAPNRYREAMHVAESTLDASRLLRLKEQVEV
ncbi:MAG TPA: hemerythrin domain-containing protein [Thermoplasmata archaeon]|nr:hemerythrin domain-containing protein [Thermoplasmata archaeon]